MNQNASAAVFCHRPAALKMSTMHALRLWWSYGRRSLACPTLSVSLRSQRCARAAHKILSLALQTRRSAFAPRWAEHLARLVLMPCLQPSPLHLAMLRCVLADAGLLLSLRGSRIWAENQAYLPYARLSANVCCTSPVRSLTLTLTVSECPADCSSAAGGSAPFSRGSVFSAQVRFA